MKSSYGQNLPYLISDWDAWKSSFINFVENLHTNQSIIKSIQYCSFYWSIQELRRFCYQLVTDEFIESGHDNFVFSLLVKTYIKMCWLCRVRRRQEAIVLVGNDLVIKELFTRQIQFNCSHRTHTKIINIFQYAWILI